MMKYRLLASCLSMVLMGLSITQALSKELSVRHYEGNLYYLPDISEEDLQHAFENSDSILVCPEDTVLCFDLFLKGDFLESDVNDIEQKYSIKIKKTMYLRMQNDQILFSLDGSNWKTWEEMFTGMISVSLNSDENMPTLKFGMEINERSQ